MFTITKTGQQVIIIRNKWLFTAIYNKIGLWKRSKKHNRKLEKMKFTSAESFINNPLTKGTKMLDTASIILYMYNPSNSSQQAGT